MNSWFCSCCRGSWCLAVWLCSLSQVKGAKARGVNTTGMLGWTHGHLASLCFLEGLLQPCWMLSQEAGPERLMRSCSPCQAPSHFAVGSLKAGMCFISVSFLPISPSPGVWHLPDLWHPYSCPAEPAGKVLSGILRVEWSGGRSAPSCTMSHGFMASQLLQECPDLIQRAAPCHSPGAEPALPAPFPAAWHRHWDDGWELLQGRAWSWSSWRLSKPGFAVGQVLHLF